MNGRRSQKMTMQTQSPMSTAGSTSDIIQAIRSEIPETQRSVPWFKRVPPEHAETVNAIHQAWHDGVFGHQKYPAARAIAAKLRDLGIDIREQGVIAWLKLPRS